MKKSPLRLELEKLVDENPEISGSEAFDKVPGPKKRDSVYKMLSNIKQSRKKSGKTVVKKVVKKPSDPQTVQMSVVLPDNGEIELKILNGSVIGTLEIGKDGVAFVAANAKKRPDAKVPYGMLRLFQDHKFSIS